MILIVGDVVDDIGVRPLERINPRSDTRAEIRMTQGGSAANVAAWLGHLGVRSRFVGKVGTDGVNRHETALRDVGVDPRLSATADLPTASIVLTLDEQADRTMYVDRGANSLLRVADIPDDVWDDVDWLHLTGYTFFDDSTRAVGTEFLSQARQRQIPASVDPSSAGFLQQCGAAAFLEWTRDATMITPNLDEARVLVGSTGPYVDFKKLAQYYEHVVVTMGSMGAGYLTEGSREQLVSPKVEVIDTTGAGDAFVAGFLSVWRVRPDPAAALAAGAAAAERCISVRGARP